MISFHIWTSIVERFIIEQAQDKNDVRRFETISIVQLADDRSHFLAMNFPSSFGTDARKSFYPSWNYVPTTNF